MSFDPHILENISSPDNDKREYATTIIENSLNQEYLAFLTLIIKILTKNFEDLPPIVYKQAAYLLSHKCFRFRTNAECMSLQKKYFGIQISNFRQFDHQIFEICVSFLASPDQVIRNQISTALAYFIGFHIDHLDFLSDGLNPIIQILSDKDKYPDGTLGALTTIKEIFLLSNFKMPSLLSLFNQYSQLIIQQLIFFLDNPSLNIQVKKLSAEIIENYIQLFMDKSIKDIKKSLTSYFTQPQPIMSLLQALKSSFVVKDVNLFSTLNHIMSYLVNINSYENSSHFISLINEYLNTTLASSLLPIEFKKAYLEFWKDIAKNDFQLKLSISRKNEFHSYILDFLPEILVSIHNFFLFDDPEDDSGFNMNELDNQELRKLSYSTLISILKISYDQSLEIMYKIIIEMNSNPSFVYQSSALLWFSALFSQPDKWNCFAPIFLSYFENFCLFLQSPNMRIRCSALTALNTLLSNYKGVMFNLPDNETILLPWPKLLNVLTPPELLDNTIITYKLIFTVLTTAINNFRGIESYGSTTIINPVAHYYDIIKDYLSKILSGPNFFISKGTLIEPFFTIFENLVNVIPLNFTEVFDALYSQTMEKLFEIKSSFDQHSSDTNSIRIRFSLLSSLCYLICTILKKTNNPNLIKGEIGQNLISFLFNFCRSDISCVTLKTIGQIYIVLGDDFPENFDATIKSIWLENLSQKIPDLIRGTAMLISDYFRSGIKITRKIEPIFIAKVYIALYNVLHNSSSWEETYEFEKIIPHIIFAMSKIVYSLAGGTKEYKFDETILNFRNLLTEVLQSYISYHVHFDNSYQIDFANHLYCCLADSFNSLARVFHGHDNKFERDNIKIFQDFLRLVKSSDFSLLSPQLYANILSALKSFILYTSMPVSINLHKKIFVQTIDDASKIQSLNTEANRVKELLNQDRKN